MISRMAEVRLRATQPSYFGRRCQVRFSSNFGCLIETCATGLPT